jgi:SAM-dependent methyltransferase
LDWQPVQRFTYLDHEHAARRGKLSALVDRLRVLYHLLIRNAPEPVVISRRPLRARQRLRRRVLFENWFPGEQEITLTAQYCRHCGFMAYTPRPAAADIRAKYERLTENEGGGPQLRTALGEYLDRQRARRTFEIVNRVTGGVKGTVLDYGGADGLIVLPFLAQGCECLLVDYYPYQLPGIQKIADDLDDMPPGLRADVIVCSHVLEHVADPRGLAQDLIRFLKEDGVLYAEVPSEVWAGIRIEQDPVTHVNFFTPKSFESLFRAAGCQIVDSCVQVEAGREIIWVVARSVGADGDQVVAPVLPGQGLDTAQRLRPGRWRSLGRLFRLRVWPRVRHLFLRLGLRLAKRGQ